MTKKDYVLIADAVKDGIYKAELTAEQADIVIDELARELQKENPRFDWDKFENACMKAV